MFMLSLSSLIILSYLGGSLVAAGELTIGSLSSLMLYTVSCVHGCRMPFHLKVSP